jgi:hypothetical protein
MHRPFAALALVGALSGVSTAAQAQFAVDLTVNGRTETRTFSSVESALSLLQGSGIRSIFPEFRAGTAVNASVNFAGLTLPITVPAGTTTAILTVPGTNSSVAFQGQTAGQTQNQLRQFFSGAVTSGDPISALPAEVRATLPAEVQNSIRATLTQVVQEAVATTIYDPIAGNPTALMPQMVASDFLAGTAPSGALLGTDTTRPDGFRFSVGAFYTGSTSGQFDVDAVTLPLRASYYNAANGTEVFLDVPIAYYETEGAHHYQGSAGLGVRQVVLRRPGLEWALTPVLRYGIAGSKNLGRGSQAVGGSVTSDLRIGLPSDFTLAIGNTVAYYQTKPYDFGGYNIRYDLQNQFYRNGVSLSHPVGEAFGVPLHLGVSFVDTRVTGDRTAVSSWQEYGVTLQTGGRTPIRLAASYIDGKSEFSAVHVGLSVAF